MTTTLPTLQLMLLPRDRSATPLLLDIDRDGRVLAPAAHDRPTGLPRRVLAVPGADCLVLWPELPARNAVQALAAARLLVPDHLATSAENQHIAVGPPVPGSTRRPVVCVEPACMRDWLARAGAIGFQPDMVVPAPLLLPPPSDPAAVSVAEHDGEWLVRGATRAFAAAPPLAHQVLGDQPYEVVGDPLAALAAGAHAAPVDLLQHAFALTSPRPEGWRAWRRAAVLAALAVASPLLVIGAGAARDHFTANRLQSQAWTEAATVLPAMPASADPRAMVVAHHAQLAAGDAFHQAIAALFTAIDSVDSTELDALSYAGDRVVAEIAHTGNADLDTVRAALADAGLPSEVTGSRTTGNRVHSTIELGAAP
ncbi:MAG: type II secretion system protein GspL [Lysobacter sp.]|nr:type II secretion system protein GspL [Lysobacter sp.]MDV5979896.1 type II secretion system protein GspL [Lysobacter sp.]